MVHAWCCSSTCSLRNSGIPGKSVSGTIDRTRWTNILVRSFLWFKSLTYLSLWTSEVYCLCCRSQWHPVLQQWIQNGFEIIRTTAGIFRPVRQSWYRRATCFVICWKLDTLSIFSNLQQAAIWKICFSTHMFIKHFLLLLLCRFTFCRFSHAVFCNSVYRT